MLLLVLVLSSAIASASGIASGSAGAILSCAGCCWREHCAFFTCTTRVLMLLLVRLVHTAARGLSCTAV